MPPSILEKIRDRVGAFNAAIVEYVTNLGPGFAIGHRFFCADVAGTESRDEWYIASCRPRSYRCLASSPRQLRQIAESIRAFGFTNPVLVDGDGQVIAGQGRLEAAKQLGLQCVPTLCIDWLTATQQSAYVIADSRLAEKSGWDRELLALELGELADLDIDETLTGFDIREIELILDAGPAALDDEPPAPATGAAICAADDLWQLGRHRLICGDVRERETWAQLMRCDKARLVGPLPAAAAIS